MKKRKIAEKDFLESYLPQTRRSQFFDILKNNFNVVVKIGLVLLAFFLLLLVKNLILDLLNTATNTAVEAGDLLKKDGEMYMKLFFIISNAIDIILYPIIFIAVAGVFRVIRQLAFSEGMFFIYFFKKGIKDNYKQFIFMGVLTALIKLGVNTLITYFSLSSFISIASLGFFIVIYIPIVVIYLYYSSIYSSTLAISLRNATYIYIKNILPTLAFVLVLFAPIILTEYFFNWPFVKQSIYALGVTLLLPIILLGGYLMYLNSFDKTINVTDYQELIRKGLYVSNEELEQFVLKGLKIKSAREFDETILNLKDIISKFPLKGKYITTIQRKDESSYKVIVDKDIYYLLQLSKEENNELSDDLLTSVNTIDEKSYFFDDKSKTFYRLYLNS